MAKSNVFDPDFDEEQDREGFSYRRARVGRQAGAEWLGASLYELPPGEASYPYHEHVANEELLVVLLGQPHLRTPKGWRELREGEVIALPAGEDGAHQLHNRSDETVRVLVVSEMRSPEIIFYPDSGKFLAGDRAPGGMKDDGRLFATYNLDEAVDYWEGEEPPSG